MEDTILESFVSCASLLASAHTSMMLLTRFYWALTVVKDYNLLLFLQKLWPRSSLRRRAFTFKSEN